MSFVPNIGDLAKHIAINSRLSNPTLALSLIPPSAKFATIASVMMLDRPDRDKLRLSTNIFGNRRQYGASSQIFNGYLYHDGEKLVHVTEQDVSYSIPLSTIVGVDRMLTDDTWLIMLNDNRGLLVGLLMPLELPSKSTVRSSNGIITDGLYGWHDELKKFGINDLPTTKTGRKINLLFIIGVVIVVTIVIYFSLSNNH